MEYKLPALAQRNISQQQKSRMNNGVYNSLYGISQISTTMRKMNNNRNLNASVDAIFNASTENSKTERSDELLRLNIKKRLKENNKALRSLNTHDIPGAFNPTREVKHPPNIMSIDDIEGAKPSRFRHRKWDQKKVTINAKYDNLFDQFGNRREELLNSEERIIDPLASSKERRKAQLNVNWHTESDYVPVFNRELRPSRRQFRGIYKNKSNVEFKWKEKENNIDHYKSVDSSLNLQVKQATENLSQSNIDSPKISNIKEIKREIPIEAIIDNSHKETLISLQSPRLSISIPTLNSQPKIFEIQRPQNYLGNIQTLNSRARRGYHINGIITFTNFYRFIITSVKSKVAILTSIQ